MQISSNLHSNVSRSTRINSSSVHTYIFRLFCLRVILQGFVTQNATVLISQKLHQKCKYPVTSLQLQNDCSCGTVLLNVLRFVHTYHLHPRLRNLIHTKRLRRKRYVTLTDKIGMQAILPITVPSKRSKVPSVNVKAIVTESFGVNKPIH